MVAPKTSPALTSLRFFAAMVVVLRHLQSMLPEPLASVSRIGYIGVPFFFLLSGFVLGQAYLARSGTVNLRQFALHRFARIYPLHLATLMIDLPHYLHIHLVVHPDTPGRMAKEIGSTLLLVQSWRNGTVDWNGSSWSLSVEFFFYLLFPAMGTLLWRTPRRWVLPLATAFYFSGLAIVSATSRTGEQSYDPYRHLATFLIGILVSRYASSLEKHSGFRHRVLTNPLFFAVTVFTGAAVAGIVSRYEALLQHGLLTPIFAVLIVAAYLGEGRLFRWIGHPVLVLLGHASFAIYMLQLPLWFLFRAQVERFPALGVPVFLIGLIALSVASFQYFELPARRWILAKSDTKS